MSKEEMTEVQGIVVQALPNTMFKVKLDDDLPAEVKAKHPEIGPEGEVLAILSGKMRMYRIRVLVGDTLTIQLDKYGGKGRIVKRL